MTPELWQTVGTIAALVMIGGYNGWRAKRAETQARGAETQARAAARAARGVEGQVGNGFARDLTERLDRIENLSQKNHDLLVDHLADHSRHDMRRDGP